MILEGYIKDVFPLVYHNVQCEPVTLIFGEGKQSVEFLAQLVEQALVEKGLKAPSEGSTDSPFMPCSILNKGRVI